jgi:RNA polymerase sigma-70 factor, ECF subfamily
LGKKDEEPNGSLDFNHVFVECSPLAWRVLVRLGVSLRDVPDACQEVFLVVHRRLLDFDPSRSSLRSWVYGICVRVASDYRRRGPQRHEYPAELEELAVSSVQESHIDELRAWQKLARVLDEMEPAKSQVLVLFDLEALPMADVASALECPLQTAYSRLHAARRIVLEAFGVKEAK